jgi:hypothetical protein
LEGSVEAAPKYRREPVATKLAPYHETLTMALMVDARLPKQAQRTAKALFEQIKMTYMEKIVAEVAKHPVNFWQQQRRMNQADEKAFLERFLAE